MNILDHGHTRRWHSNPDHALRNSVDTVHAHQARMLIIRREILPGHNPEIDNAILAHDLAEVFTRDWSSPDKWAIPGMAEALQMADDAYLKHIGFTKLRETHQAILKLLDRMDAIYWVSHVAPDLLDAEEWRTASWVILESAECLGELIHERVKVWRAKL